MQICVCNMITEVCYDKNCLKESHFRNQIIYEGTFRKQMRRFSTEWVCEAWLWQSEQKSRFSQCLGFIISVHQAVPCRYQHIITALVQALNHNRHKNPLLCHSNPLPNSGKLISYQPLEFLTLFPQSSSYHRHSQNQKPSSVYLGLGSYAEISPPIPRITSLAYLSKLSNTCWASCQ